MYILNGPNIFPQVEYKFNSFTDDPVNGSIFCHVAIGTNAVKSDEQDATFQGRNEDKSRVHFKRAGD